ncbi:hypothetical protein Bca101_039884 [Brassica carinata]
MHQRKPFIFIHEINFARNKVKALHHEVTCKNALLKAKCSEQEVWFLACVQYADFDGPTYEWVVISRQPNLIGK